MNRLVVLLLAVVVTTTPATRATATAAAVTAPAEVTRKVYLSATGADGAAVTDLTAADVTVKEGGKDRAVVSLQPAVAPMHIALLVDDAGLGAFQSAVAQFLQRTHGNAQFSITLLNPQAMKILDFTDDVGALKGALGRLGQRGRMQPDGDQMPDAIFQAAKVMQQRKAERPVIVAMTVAGGQPQSVEPNDVLTALRTSGAALNVLHVVGAELGMVMGDGPKQSGGRIEQAGTATAIAAGALKFAESLQRQYLLTYTLPDGVKMADRIAVSTSRKGVTLTSPSRISDK